MKYRPHHSLPQGRSCYAYLKIIGMQIGLRRLHYRFVGVFSRSNHNTLLLCVYVTRKTRRKSVKIASKSLNASRTELL